VNYSADEQQRIARAVSALVHEDRSVMEALTRFFDSGRYRDDGMTVRATLANGADSRRPSFAGDTFLPS